MKLDKTVKVYDLGTKRLSEIPEAELAPGFALAHVKGVGLAWIDLQQVKAEENFKHPKFNSKTSKLIEREIRLPLFEVAPKSLAEWEDGFRKDTHPMREIGLWLRIASRFARFTASTELTPAQKRDVFKVMLHCTLAGSPQQVLETVTLEALSREQAGAAIEAFTSSEE